LLGVTRVDSETRTMTTPQVVNVSIELQGPCHAEFRTGSAFCNEGEIFLKRWGDMVQS